MMPGLDKRLNSFFSPVDNRALCIACDHGLMTDPNKSWLQIAEVIHGAVQANADGLLLSSGQISRFLPRYGKGIMPGFIVRTDWTNLLRFSEKPNGNINLLPVDRIEYRRLISAREVLYQYGGSASIGFLFVDPGRELESQTVKASRELIEESHEVGLPCIIEVLPLPGGQSTSESIELLRRGVLLALELGADAIKMPFTDENEYFCSAIHKAGRRLFVLGGSNLSDEDLFIRLIQKALDSGVDGLLVGRNVSSSKDPTGLIFRLRSVVHPDSGYRK